MKKTWMLLILSGLFGLSVLYLGMSPPTEGEYREAAETEAIEETEDPAAEVIRDSEPIKVEELPILINRQNPLPGTYQAELVETKYRNISGEKTAAQALEEMLEEGEKEELQFVVCSGWRSREEQRMLYLNQIQKNISQGMGRPEALKAASAVQAEPGESEHESGLAFDIVALDHQTLDDTFADTDEAVWLRRNAPRFGFILRYPEGKEDITGYSYEPWHFRYVGKMAAQTITQAGLTLEEYVEA